MPTIDYIARPYAKSADCLSHNKALHINGEHRKKLEFALVFVLYLIN